MGFPTAKSLYGTFKADLPPVIEAELKKEGDEVSIKKLQTWLSGFEEAGIDFDGTKKVADYQKLLVNALFQAELRQNRNGSSSWFSTKNILIALGVSIACVYGYERYRKSHQKDKVNAEVAKVA